VVKLLVGIGPLLALGVLTPAWSTWALAGYLGATAAVALPTKEHRGLSHVAAGMDLEVAR
jgi:hypothetical protein